MSRFTASTGDGTSVAYPDDAPVVPLDVRDDLRAGRNPLPKILAAIRNLDSGEVLHLRTTFAPVALVEILEAQGFVHHLSSEHDGGWSIWFWRPAATSRPAPRPGARRTPAGHAYSILSRRFRDHG